MVVTIFFSMLRTVSTLHLVTDKMTRSDKSGTTVSKVDVPL